jgi:hypothetical protein
MVRIYTRPLTIDEVDSADVLTPTEDTGGGGQTGGETDTGSLASTGFDPIPIAGLSVLAIAAGVVIARRRHHG